MILSPQKGAEIRISDADHTDTEVLAVARPLCEMLATFDASLLEFYSGEKEANFEVACAGYMGSLVGVQAIGFVSKVMLWYEVVKSG